MAVNLKQRAYEQIRGELLTGKLKPGAVLLPEALAKEFGMSRTPVREALNQLQDEGMVRSVPRLGTVVRDWDRKDLEELFDLREMLEAGAVARAAPLISDAEIEKLRKLCQQYLTLARQLREAGVTTTSSPIADKLNILDVAFHMKLLESSGNGRLRKIVSDLHLMTQVFGRQAQLPGVSLLSRVAHSWRDHCRIVRALTQRSAAEADYWTSKHIAWARRYHLAAFEWQQRHRISESDNGWPQHVLELIGQLEEPDRALGVTGSNDRIVRQSAKRLATKVVK